MMFGRKDRKMNEYQNALVEQHYAEIENIYRTMRGWKHDWHNHIQALSAQLDSGEYKKARSYLDEINQSILTIDTVIKTGNTMAADSALRPQTAPPASWNESPAP